MHNAQLRMGAAGEWGKLQQYDTNLIIVFILCNCYYYSTKRPH